MEEKVLGIWAGSVVQGKKDSCISYDTTGMLARGLGRRIDPIVVFGACISSGSL